MCDEMKLDKNVIWNSKSHEVHGFAGDFNNVHDDIQSILLGNEEKPIAKQVNQWKFRSVTNKTLDCEFF